jgi:hypothetical protein
MIETTCRGCGATITPDRSEIVLGPSVWRYCAACRSQSNDTPRGPAVCPHCGRWLKRGAHRNGCPGRRRRGRAPPQPVGA